MPRQNASRRAAAQATHSCGHCGARVAAGDRFCGDCGEPLTAEASTPARLPPASGPAPTREWARAFSAEGAAYQELIDKDQALALASALRRLRDGGALGPERIAALLAWLRYLGPERSTWTVGLGTLNWNRLEGTAWQAADAPAWLGIDVGALADADAGDHANAGAQSTASKASR